MLGDPSYSSSRSEATRQRHGDDFYARIGRKSWEVRRRAQAGDTEAAAALQERRQARARRGRVWLQLLEAQEAVSLLRDELHSRARTNAESCRALQSDSFLYTDRLRRELAQAEARLAALQDEHQLILKILRALPDPPAV